MGRFLCIAAFGIIASLVACQTQMPPNQLQGRPAVQGASQPVARVANRIFPRWSFNISQAGCHARLMDGDITVSVDTSPARTMSVSIATIPRSASAARAVKVAFVGGQSWHIPARDNGRSVEASFPKGPEGLDDLLTLLGGGRLSFVSSGGTFFEHKLPDAGVAGRDWYSCAAGPDSERSMLNGAATR